MRLRLELNKRQHRAFIVARSVTAAAPPLARPETWNGALVKSAHLSLCCLLTMSEQTTSSEGHATASACRAFTLAVL